MVDKKSKTYRVFSGVLFLLLALWKAFSSIAFVVTGRLDAYGSYQIGTIISFVCFLILAIGLLWNRDRLCRIAALALVLVCAYNTVSSMIGTYSQNGLLIFAMLIVTAFTALPELLFYLGLRAHGSAIGFCAAALTVRLFGMMLPYMTLRGDFNLVAILDEMVWMAAVFLAGLALRLPGENPISTSAQSAPEPAFVYAPDMWTEEAIRERVDTLEKLLQDNIITHQEYEDKLLAIPGIHQNQNSAR